MMKTPTEIKQKIRTIEFEYLKRVYEARLSSEPQNCVYNKKALLPGSAAAVTRVCSYFTDAESIQVCDTAECSKSCNAFAPRYDKRVLRELLQDDIEKNPTKYPELMVLNWAIDGEKMEQPDLAEPEKQAIVTANVTATRWKQIQGWASDLMWKAYFKFNDLLERVFGK